MGELIFEASKNGVDWKEVSSNAVFDYKYARARIKKARTILKIITTAILLNLPIILCVLVFQPWGLEIDCQGKPVSFEVLPHCGESENWYE